MTSRILPASEWPRLAGTELADVWAQMSPETATIFVVENDGGEIVGCWSLLRLLHAEGLWIRPDAQGNAAAFRRLLTTMSDLAMAEGAQSVLTSALSPLIVDRIRRLGGSAMPGQPFALPLPVGR